METATTSDKFQRAFELLRSSKNLVLYSGAGISTAANVPDFRGEGGLLSGMGKGVLGIQEHLLDSVMPTYSHMAVKALMDSGLVKYVITSNHDNLHQKSGIPEEKISNLFGNAYIEECLKCKSQFKRRVAVPSLGRYCDHGCGGRLVKSGVRFGQQVPEVPLKNASRESQIADVALVFGKFYDCWSFQ
eukprot:TRINITY_DN5336_c0_g1_i1.p1 TRINITY_DN5336_c0_g1~~TRINITY_DN5336_c0_g1_i1.p1  ORF type:complete len:188 (+),score=43.56 TRINITY_DN5336_c0_g1_i1:58-621(+)